MTSDDDWEKIATAHWMRTRESALKEPLDVVLAKFFLGINSSFVDRLYDHYVQHDKHFFFPEQSTTENHLLKDAGEIFARGDEKGCLESLILFTDVNKGTVIEQDLPLRHLLSGAEKELSGFYDGGSIEPSDQVSQVKKLDELFGRFKTEIGQWEYERDVLERFREEQQSNMSAWQLYQRGNANFRQGLISEALSDWTESYRAELFMTESLHALVTFYGVILDDLPALRQKFFRTMEGRQGKDTVLNTIADMAALEYLRCGRLEDARQYISQHEVFDLASDEGAQRQHLILKISKEGGKERVEAERHNLAELSDELGTQVMGGAKVYLPFQTMIFGGFPDFSILMEHFVSDSKTLRDLFKEDDPFMFERLKHLEIVLAYTAKMQIEGSNLFHSPPSTAQDYLDAFRSKFEKVTLGKNRSLPDSVAYTVHCLAQEIEEMPSAFYTNASPDNFLVVEKTTGFEYYKIDVESTDNRCALIDFHTLVADPDLGLEEHLDYLFCFYELCFFALDKDHAVDRMDCETDYVRDFMINWFAGDEVTQEQRDRFLQEYAANREELPQKYLLAPAFLSHYRMIHDEVVAYRDLTVILDRTLENQRLKQAIPRQKMGDELLIHNKLVSNSAQIEFRTARARARLAAHINPQALEELMSALSS